MSDLLSTLEDGLLVTCMRSGPHGRLRRSRLTDETAFVRCGVVQMLFEEGGG